MTTRKPPSSQPSLIAVAAISAVEPVSRPPGWLRVRVGRSNLAMLHPIEASRIDARPGQLLDDERLKSLNEAAARSRVRRDAERLLARRALTRSELQRRLLDKDHTPASITAVLAALEQAQALDDERLAAAAAQRALTSGRRAGREVVRALESRGVHSKLARHAVAAAVHDTGKSDFDRALQLATTRLRGELVSKDVATQRRRLAGVLARRGYDEDTIEQVLERLVKPPPTSDSA
jgi:regulatory protein